jgi:hypothetical protein
MTLQYIIIGFVSVWVLTCAFLFLRFLRFVHNDWVNHCCCKRHMLGDKEFHRTLNVFHSRAMCAPVREMIR